MATNFLWGGISQVSLLTTQLNSLGASTTSAYGPEINNTQGPQLAILHLHLASNVLTFDTTSSVSVLLIPSTTPNAAAGAYPTLISGFISTPNYASAVIYLNPTTQAGVTDETLPNVLIPSGYFKTIAINNTAGPLPASGNLIEMFTTPTQF